LILHIGFFKKLRVYRSRSYETNGLSTLATIAENGNKNGNKLLPFRATMLPFRATMLPFSAAIASATICCRFRQLCC